MSGRGKAGSGSVVVKRIELISNTVETCVWVADQDRQEGVIGEEIGRVSEHRKPLVGVVESKCPRHGIDVSSKIKPNAARRRTGERQSWIRHLYIRDVELGDYPGVHVAQGNLKRGQRGLAKSWTEALARGRPAIGNQRCSLRCRCRDWSQDRQRNKGPR
jgi:hypothetical protein